MKTIIGIFVMMLVLVSAGSASAYWPDIGDINGDGYVSGLDLAKLQYYYFDRSVTIYDNPDLDCNLVFEWADVSYMGWVVYGGGTPYPCSTASLSTCAVDCSQYTYHKYPREHLTDNMRIAYFEEAMFDGWVDPATAIIGWTGNGCYVIKQSEWDEITVACENDRGCMWCTEHRLKSATPPTDSSCDNHYIVYTASSYYTGAGGYPSIAGTFKGKFTPNYWMNINELFLFPLPGTGGHAEYARINGHGYDMSGSWSGYGGYRWDKIRFYGDSWLQGGMQYDIEIRSGSYPEMFTSTMKSNSLGTVTCTSFTDVNGVVSYNKIPAFSLRTW